MSALKTEPRFAIPAFPRPSEPQQQQRPRLQVIVGKPKRKTMWFLVSYLVPVLAAVAIILGINVAVSTHQYEVVSMKQEQTALIHDNEALTQHMKNLQAPQNLAAQASQLGMVMPSAVGSIDVDTQKVTGNPAPASKKNKPTTWVAKPGVASATEPEIMKAAPSSVSAAAITSQKTPSLPEANLNGGTIPAPQQK